LVSSKNILGLLLAVEMKTGNKMKPVTMFIMQTMGNHVIKNVISSLAATAL
jgi:hypothetical protein